MEDTISRQAAIDALEGEIEVVGKANAEAVLKYTKMVCDKIKALPSAQPRWIPVEERLPEVGKRVLVTIPLVNGYPWVGIAWHGTPMYEDKVCFYVADSEWGDYEIREVTAWMPLPAGYERGEELREDN